MTPTEVNIGIGSFLTANVLAKILYNDRWYSNQLSNIRLAKTLIDYAGINDKELARLQRYINRQQFKVTCVSAIARVPFPPVATLAVAYNFFKK